jgi:REP element-mobilizing transposase RayT
LHIHLIFSTKNRAPVLTDSVRVSFHRYAAAVMRNLKCPVTLVNSVEDHVHVLFELARTASVSEVVEEIKTSTSKWIKTQGNEFSEFAWQSGYGAFAVSQSNVASVSDYIGKQQEHHRSTSFQQEYREFLVRHEIEFDERYVWD